MPELNSHEDTAKKGVSAIIYDKNGGLYFLILHRNTNWKGWEFPKGGLEAGETVEQALSREIVEETGLKKIKVTHKLDIKREFTKDNVKHSFNVFLAQASMNIPVLLSTSEHDTYLWTKEDRVLEKLNWDDEKKIFREALKLLK